MVKSYGWVVAHEILLSALGLGVVSILDSLFYSQVPSPRSQVPGPKSQVPSPKSQVPSPKSQVPSPSRLTILTVCLQSEEYAVLEKAYNRTDPPLSEEWKV